MNIKAKVFRNGNYVCFTILEQDERLLTRKEIFSKSSKNRYAVQIINAPQLNPDSSILYLRGGNLSYNSVFCETCLETAREAKNVYKKLVNTFEAINKIKLEETPVTEEDNYEMAEIG